MKYEKQNDRQQKKKWSQMLLWGGFGSYKKGNIGTEEWKEWKGNDKKETINDYIDAA